VPVPVVLVLALALALVSVVLEEVNLNYDGGYSSWNSRGNSVRIGVLAP
jgi:hypothetical protein